MKTITVEHLMPEDKDFYIVINDRKQGFMMYGRTPIAHVGYQGDKLVGKPGWFYKTTEFDVIRTHDSIEDVFKEIFQLVDNDYTFSNFHSAFFVRFSPQEVPNGYDRVTYIDGQVEWKRMPATVWVGSSIYEQIDNEVMYAQGRLKGEIRRMLKDDVVALEELIRTIKATMNDMSISTGIYNDVHAVNLRISKDIANIRSSIYDICYNFN